MVAGVLLLLGSAGVSALEFSVDWVEEGCIEIFPVEAQVSWNAESAGIGQVEVRLGSVDGTLFSTGPAVGNAQTGPWVRESTEFFLLAASDGEVLASTRLSTPSCSAIRRADSLRRLDQRLEEGEEVVEFRLSPPRLIYCGQPVERTTVRVIWDVEAVGADTVHIFLGSVNGTLFSQGQSTGEAETRNWVRDGTTFVLYLPEFERAVARREFRILPCAMAYPR